MNRKERRAARKTGQTGGLSQSFSSQLRDMGDQHAQAGDIAQAEGLYRQALASDPNDIVTLLRLGHLATRTGRIDEAFVLFSRAIGINRHVPELHMGMAATCHAAGRLEEAALHCAEAARVRPDYAEAHLEQGNVLMELNRPADAVLCYRRAVTSRPGYVQALVNLGRALYGLGKPEEAIEAWQRAQAADPRHPLPAMNLGIALVRQGRHAEAVEQLQRALAIAPGSVDVLTNLAKAHVAAEDILQALQTTWRALAISETQDAKAVFVECLRRFRFTADMPELRGAVARAVTDAWARLDDFNAAATDLAKHSAALAHCVARVVQAWPRRLAGDALWTPTEQAAICADPLLRALMESAPVCDLDLERFLTCARREMLDQALATTPAVTTEPAMLAFQCALARQSFLNEYVHPFDDEEAYKVAQLRQRLSDALAAQTEAPALWVAALGAYEPLHQLPLAQMLNTKTGPLKGLIDQQVSEPLEEMRLRAAIRALTPIDDAVSLAVRDQYEHNPYPRWAKLPLPAEPDTIEGALRALFPSLPAGSATRDGCDVLIAGCGTGHCAIEAARRYRGARVLAVDLSLTSLGYAMRKTRELAIANIDYAQADILHLGTLGRTLGRSFDVIEAGGVLHHLDDPFAGWRVLLELLRPGGFMYLGLYSALGRKHIVNVRSLIAERGYRSSPDDIRRFREQLVADAERSDIGRLWQSPDFYNMSGCRDLCFHVQEHRLTIPQIKTFLDDNGLTFIGFVVDPRSQNEVESRFPNEDELDRWHRYETGHPNMFSGQYHFWLQKPQRTAD
jgi:tetratricopeptide (TPR) repeat protein/SAM-dependent methyltransferase